MLEITVYLYTKKVGILYEEDGLISFEYEQSFLDTNLNLSPLNLPFNKETYSNYDDKYYQTLAGVFFDSLPDKFGTKVIERYYESKNVPLKDLTLLQKLIFIGKRGMGALEYEPSEKVLEDEKSIEALEIRKLYESSKKILKGEAEETIHDMLSFMDSGASAGGARAKAVIGWNRDSKTIVSGSNTIPSDYDYWLLKFDDYDDRKEKASDFTKLEYIYMQMAKESGINIPEIEMFSDGDLSHFLIKRFDRVKGKKVHMHSLASIAHVNFNVPQHYSYDEALRVVKFMTKDAQDVKEFYRRAVFNVMAINQDDHAKNTSFLMDENGEWRLSPAYDITYANGQGFTKTHQMSIKGKVKDISKKILLELGVEKGIKEQECISIIQKTVTAVSTFKMKAEKIGIRNDLKILVLKDILERKEKFL